MLTRTLLPMLAVAAPMALALGWPFAARAGSDETRLSGPYTHDNLTIFLVHGKSAPGPVPLMLEEALAKGAVTVHETGTVSELSIENTGSDDVLIHAGDIVKGGKQDRVLTTTMILKPKSGKVPLAAFCVEQSRWSARGHEDVARFASSAEMMPSREAKLAMKMRSKPGSYEPAGPTTAGLRRQALEAEPNVDDGDRANIAQRRVHTSPGTDAQGEVWRNVANVQAALSSSLGARVNSETSASSLQLALENEKVASARKAYTDALEAAATKESDVTGYVFAINGRINSADIYASNALFRKLWPRLLKASATEALGAKTNASGKIEPVTQSAVEAFLGDAAKGKESTQEPAKGIKLMVRDSEKAADFATMSDDGFLVHRNVLAH